MSVKWTKKLKQLTRRRKQLTKSIFLKAAAEARKIEAKAAPAMRASRADPQSGPSCRRQTLSVWQTLNKEATDGP